VLLPGEVRWENYRRAETQGIPVDPARWAEVVRIASDVSVTPPRQKAFAPA
jgi:LDH2 family malate/lactate/ureidoglycolate dehydrogenase